VAGQLTEREFESPPLAEQVKGAVIWRSGSQAIGQLITWTATFMVVRLLSPADYGLIAMCDVVFTFLGLMSGWGFASALIQSESVDRQRIRQVFGLLILINGALAAAQFALAPLAAAYFHQPMIVDLLRVQAALYLLIPFVALPQNLLARRLDFRSQGQVNLIGALAGAATALACAYAGLGVWTLIAAPAALWLTRAIGMSVAARLWVWPSFRFGGIGKLIGFGGAMVAVQFLWFAQTQADVFIAGRTLPAHELGIYTTSLFLTQILAAKFVPPLNDVAFAAYSKIQARRETMQWAFLKSVRLIMLVAMPFYFGLAVTAEPLVFTVLGEQWLPTAELVPILALAMPLMTLQILFSPATNALGQPRIAVRTGIAGALLLPAAFLVGINWGVQGLAWAWVGGMGALLLVTIALSLPVIGISRSALVAAIAPGWLASAAMAASVAAFDSLLPDWGERLRLAMLVPFGIAAYAALLFLFARPIVDEVMGLVRPRRLAAQTL
jgi:O-antigen/teichoic acid export membrane protein